VKTVAPAVPVMPTVEPSDIAVPTVVLMGDPSKIMLPWSMKFMKPSIASAPTRTPVLALVLDGGPTCGCGAGARLEGNLPINIHASFFESFSDNYLAEVVSSEG
jgi:hypothetical protein